MGVDPEMSCLDVIFQKSCKEGSLCGESKTTRDIMKCCGKDSNNPGSVCLSRRRRLSENAIITDVDSAEACAEACFRRAMGPSSEASQTDSCVAWILENGKCKLTTQCYHQEAADSMLLPTKLWNTIEGVDPLKGSGPAPKQVRKWSSTA